MPPVSVLFGIYFCFFIFWKFNLFLGGRSPGLLNSVKKSLLLFPSWTGLKTSKMTILMGGLLFFVVGSLFPAAVIGFHFPLLGIGVSACLWSLIFIFGSGLRPLQYKKEYLGDASLSGAWASVAIFIETMSRTARAITLGARISVNIMMGAILHSVLGESDSSWGMLILCSFEAMVAFVQSYVFLLLLWFYGVDLE